MCVLVFENYTGHNYICERYRSQTQTEKAMNESIGGQAGARFRKQHGNVFYSIVASITDENSIVVYDAWDTREDTFTAEMLVIVCLLLQNAIRTTAIPRSKAF